MRFSQRDLEISARFLVKRHGLVALRLAQAQVRQMEQWRAYDAAETWKLLEQAIRNFIEATTKRKAG